MNINGRRGKIINPEDDRVVYIRSHEYVLRHSLDQENACSCTRTQGLLTRTYLPSLSISRIDGNYNGIRIFLCA